MKETITIRVQGGVIYENKEPLGRAIRTLKDARYDITIEPHKVKRSNQANRYY